MRLLQAWWPSRLWRKYAVVMAGLSAAVMLGFGGFELAASVAAALSQAGRLQNAQAGEAAFALRAALINIDRHVAAVRELPWRHDWLGPDVRREEYARLLRLMPAAESVRYHGPDGQELLRVSRRNLDTQAYGPNAGAARQAPVPDFEPTVEVTLADTDATLGGRTVVRVNLRALARELRSALSLPGAEVYAVDADGVVVLHRDPLQMLTRRRVALEAEEQALVQALGQARPASAAASAPAAVAPVARAATAAPGASPAANAASAPASAPPPDDTIHAGRGLQGGEVLRAAMPIERLGWLMVVERPRADVMRPVWSTVWRTAAFVVLAVLLASAAAITLAGRLSRPIRQLHQAAGRVAAGQLDTRIEIRSGDELEDLATQFNSMAASLRASVTDLEDKVAARTRDLERATRHKSEFLANMSHELRTPLNAILGFADVLREGMAGPLSAEQNEHIADIHASGLHLLSLINDVLDLSKIEAGQLDLEPDDFDVIATVQSALALVRQRAIGKGLKLQMDLDPALQEQGLWFADARRFKQVVLNLLSNAVKFTPAGGTVALRAGLDATEGLWVEVQDDGIGIAAADHAAVFEEFRQVGSGSSERAEGTGLGLALVRRLVQQHGGQVSLRSELGAGACFRFNIPGRPAGAPAEDVERAS